MKDKKFPQLEEPSSEQNVVDALLFFHTFSQTITNDIV